jgi:hypothetical protein
MLWSRFEIEKPVERFQNHRKVIISFRKVLILSRQWSFEIGIRCERIYK